MVQCSNILVVTVDNSIVDTVDVLQMKTSQTTYRPLDGTKQERATLERDLRFIMEQRYILDGVSNGGNQLWGYLAGDLAAAAVSATMVAPTVAVIDRSVIKW